MQRLMITVKLSNSGAGVRELAEHRRSHVGVRKPWYVPDALLNPSCSIRAVACVSLARHEFDRRVRCENRHNRCVARGPVLGEPKGMNTEVTGELALAKGGRRTMTQTVELIEQTWREFGRGKSHTPWSRGTTWSDNELE